MRGKGIAGTSKEESETSSVGRGYCGEERAPAAVAW